jgi:hypothetical protein
VADVDDFGLRADDGGIWDFVIPHGAARALTRTRIRPLKRRK